MVPEKKEGWIHFHLVDAAHSLGIKVEESLRTKKRRETPNKSWYIADRNNFWLMRT